MTARRRLLLAAAGVLIGARELHAQRRDRVVHIAILEDANEGANAVWWAAFWSRLRELGYVEGENLRASARYSQGAQAQLPRLAAELLALRPDVLIGSTTPAALALMKATSRIPIVFNGAGAPVESGLVASLARPGANVTGVSIMSPELSARWLDTLIEIRPGARKFAFLGQSSNAATAIVTRSLTDTATRRDLVVRPLEATTAEEIDRAFEVMVTDRFDGFIVAAVPVILPHRARIIELAARHRLPAIFARQEYAEAGGLLSLSPDRNAIYRRTADYVHRILQGSNPGELPVEQPTRFELVVNLRTAKTIGLAIPQTVLLRADRTIE